VIKGRLKAARLTLPTQNQMYTMSTKRDWSNVFDHYPNVDEIWVCDGQPFLTAKDARSHERTTGKPSTRVQRPAKVEQPPKTEAKAQAKKAPAKKGTKK
jgi:hypothetical protein